ncbi:MAG: hypothetical protein HWE34_15365, partial [Methylocystaceae bacterium]|nr:hypothetical protein [Methylocystaceae bacterium]
MRIEQFKSTVFSVGVFFLTSLFFWSAPAPAFVINNNVNSSNNACPAQKGSSNKITMVVQSNADGSGSNASVSMTLGSGNNSTNYYSAGSYWFNGVATPGDTISTGTLASCFGGNAQEYRILFEEGALSSFSTQSRIGIGFCRDSTDTSTSGNGYYEFSIGSSGTENFATTTRGNSSNTTCNDKTPPTITVENATVELVGEFGAE